MERLKSCKDCVYHSGAGWCTFEFRQYHTATIERMDSSSDDVCGRKAKNFIPKTRGILYRLRIAIKFVFGFQIDLTEKLLQEKSIIKEVDTNFGNKPLPAGSWID